MPTRAALALVLAAVVTVPLRAQPAASPADLSANIWLSDVRTFDQMNKVWDGWVDPQNTPARATVEAKLARADLLVEVMVTAAIPSK